MQQITFQTEDGTTWRVVKAQRLKRTPGRPRLRNAQWALTVKRLNGNKPYRSYLRNNGTFVTPH